jgi:hypothetical protein
MTALQRLIAEASTYPSARFTDDGYHAWAFAVRTFRAQVLEIVVGQTKYDDLSNPQFDQLEADIVQDFPVEDYFV